MSDKTETIRLPLPLKLEPRPTTRSLMTSLPLFFYPLYNAPNSRLRELLISVNGEDALTGNRMFDRHAAVGMIRKAAEEAKNPLFDNASDWDIHCCVREILRREHGITLKSRRAEYKRLTVAE